MERIGRREEHSIRSWKRQFVVSMCVLAVCSVVMLILIVISLSSRRDESLASIGLRVFSSFALAFVPIIVYHAAVRRGFQSCLIREAKSIIQQSAHMCENDAPRIVPTVISDHVTRSRATATYVQNVAADGRMGTCVTRFVERATLSANIDWHMENAVLNATWRPAIEPLPILRTVNVWFGHPFVQDAEKIQCVSRVYRKGVAYDVYRVDKHIVYAIESSVIAEISGDVPD